MTHDPTTAHAVHSLMASQPYWRAMSGAPAGLTAPERAALDKDELPTTLRAYADRHQRWFRIGFRVVALVGLLLVAVGGGAWAWSNAAEPSGAAMTWLLFGGIALLSGLPGSFLRAAVGQHLWRIETRFIGLHHWPGGPQAVRQPPGIRLESGVTLQVPFEAGGLVQHLIPGGSYRVWATRGAQPQLVYIEPLGRMDQA